MKTKLLALVLLAGGSMFAQTQFSIGINAGQNYRGYYVQAPAYNNRYAQQRFSRGYTQMQNRDFDQDERNGNRGQAFNERNSDERDRSRGNNQEYRQNGFRNR